MPLVNMLVIPLYTAVHNIWCIGVPYCGFKNKFESNWSYFSLPRFI